MLRKAVVGNRDLLKVVRENTKRSPLEIITLLQILSSIASTFWSLITIMTPGIVNVVQTRRIMLLLLDRSLTNKSLLRVFVFLVNATPHRVKSSDTTGTLEVRYGGTRPS